MTTPTSRPVTYCHPQRCVRTLAPGMVKRLFLRGPLHAYQLGCPFCGFRTLVLQGDGRFTEDGEGETAGATKPDGPEVRFRHVRLVGSAVLTCGACRVPARVVDGVWVAVDVEYITG